MVNIIKIAMIPAFISLTGISCSDTSEFNSGSPVKKSESDTSDSIGASGNEADVIGSNGDPITEVLQTIKEVETGKTDILWVLDNSGSMSNEIDLVSKNMNAFFKKIKSNSDARVGVISSIGDSGIALTLSDEIREDLVLYNTGVSSTNALNKTLEFLGVAPPGNKTLKFLGVAPPGRGLHFGVGKFFFRKESSKVLVIVTDDDSRLSSDDFLARLKTVIDIREFKLFGFTGTPESKCSISKKGQQYINLADMTSGKIFDICEEDWSQNFDLLADSIIDTIKSKYDVSRVIKETISIEIGGKAVSKDKYRFVNKTITFAENLISDSDLEIKIKYLAK